MFKIRIVITVFCMRNTLMHYYISIVKLSKERRKKKYKYEDKLREK